MGCQVSRISDGTSSSSPATRNNTGRRKKYRRSEAERQELERRNSEIEAGLANTRKSQKSVKILLLGSGESGKSTVLKQMRVIHGLDFSSFERNQYSKVIWSDAVQSMRILIQQAYELGIPLQSAENNQLKSHQELLLNTDPHHIYEEDKEDIEGGKRNFLDDFVLEYGDSQLKRNPSQQRNDDLENEANEKTGLLDSSDPNITKAEVAEAIDTLWKSDSGIKQCMNRSNEFQLEVNASYYFDNIYSYADKGYQATDKDILTGRIKTTGITETVFNVKGMDFHMFDVGGQRSERRKWIHCFDDVTAILYVVAASEYDQVLFEDHTVNRMTEALSLFESICNSRWFHKTPMILFLNKIDILAKKLAESSSFKKYHPDFQGDETSTEQVLAYLQQKFTSVNYNTNRQIYVHHTCATDTESMKFVMQAVTDMILQKNMASSGII